MNPHITVGLTRSPSVVLAYIMMYGTDFHSSSPLRYQLALSVVKAQRGPKIKVKLFERELLMLEDFLYGGAPCTAGVRVSLLLGIHTCK